MRFKPIIFKDVFEDDTASANRVLIWLTLHDL